MSLAVTVVSTCESELDAGDGTATATAVGGEPFTYLWDNGQTTATATGLSAGWHWVKVINTPNGDPVALTVYAFVKVGICENHYDFNMSESELQCFLQVASCNYGDKAHDLFNKNSMGIRDKCEEKKLFQLLKNIETAACWHPKSIVDIEDPSYYVFVLSPGGLQTSALLTITILENVLTYQFDNMQSFAVNMVRLVNYINGLDILVSPFRAQTDGSNLWLFAPAGYEGVIPTITLSNGTVVVSTTLTTEGFQDGRVPCGSYVDWQGVYHEAPEDCLSEDQVGNILDNIKEYVDCSCEPTDEILNDEV